MAQVRNVRITLNSRLAPAWVEHDRKTNRSFDAYLESQMRLELLGLGLGEAELLRWAVVSAVKNGSSVSVEIEATVVKDLKFPRNPFKQEAIGAGPRRDVPLFLNIVPTGIGAALGGCLGDAMAINIALSRLGVLISHPNTYNGGYLNFIEPPMQYCEGRSIDLFSAQACNFDPISLRDGYPLGQNKIVCVVDSGLDEWTKRNVLYQINAFAQGSGADIVAESVWTKKPIGGRARRQPSGAFAGDVENLDTLVEAAAEVKKTGADAVAVFTHIAIKDEHLRAYFAGTGANPFGGHEAIISHTLLSLLGIPAAHGPALTKDEIEYLQLQVNLPPEAAGESAAPFYVSSVLRGLQYAPRIVSSEARVDPQSPPLEFTSVNAVLCPASAVGGIPMMRAHHLGIPIIGVKENKTVLKVFPENIGLGKIFTVENYLEAIGLLLRVFRDSGEITNGRIRTEQEKNNRTELEAYGRELVASVGVNPAALRRPLPSIS